MKDFCIEGFGIEGIGVVCLGAHKGPGSRGAALKEGTSKGATKKSGFEWSVSERFATETLAEKGFGTERMDTKGVGNKWTPERLVVRDQSEVPQVQHWQVWPPKGSKCCGSIGPAQKELAQENWHAGFNHKE